MIATCKKLVTDIQRDKDLDTKLPEYAELLGRQYNCYATVKGSMNYYTMKEVCDEQEDKNMDVCKYFALLTGLLDRHLVKREAVDEDSMEAIAQLRSNVEYKMHILEVSCLSLCLSVYLSLISYMLLSLYQSPISHAHA